MNDATKKLIELLDSFPYELSDYVGDNEYFVVDNHIELAKYLINSGVTVQKHGQWERAYDGRFVCNNCKHVKVAHQQLCFLRNTGCWNYCPNCGAKMDGGK